MPSYEDFVRDYWAPDRDQVLQQMQQQQGGGMPTKPGAPVSEGMPNSDAIAAQHPDWPRDPIGRPYDPNVGYNSGIAGGMQGGTLGGQAQPFPFNPGTLASLAQPQPFQSQPWRGIGQPFQSQIGQQQISAPPGGGDASAFGGQSTTGMQPGTLASLAKRMPWQQTLDGKGGY